MKIVIQWLTLSGLCELRYGGALYFIDNYSKQSRYSRY